MAGWTKMVDMARSTEEKISAIEESMPMPMQAADYPYGLTISLDERDLEKLDLDDGCEAGDTIDLRAMAVVKSVSKNEFNGKSSCRVELQIQKLAVESEDEEAMAMTKRYGRSKG
jgi:hypothetical protein